MWQACNRIESVGDHRLIESWTGYLSMALFRKGVTRGSAPAYRGRGVWEFDAAAYGQVPDNAIAAESGLDDARLIEACEAGERGDWSVVDKLLEEVGDDWDLRYLHIVNIAACTRDALGHFPAWRAAHPESANAATLHASALAGLSADYSADAEARYRFSCEADAAAARAAELAPDDPTPWAIRVFAAIGRECPHDELRSIFAEAVRRAPLHRRAHTNALRYWRSRHAGSDELVERFVREQTALAPDSGMAFELRIEHMQDLWARHLDSQRGAKDIYDFFRTGPGRPLVHEAVDDFWTGQVPSGAGVGLADQNRLAWALCQAERYDEACEVWTAIGGAMTTGYPWQCYADKRAAFQDLRKRSFANSSRQPAGWRHSAEEDDRSVAVTHEPPDYVCPFCRLAAGGEDALNSQRDIVRRNAGAVAFVAPRWWPGNLGHVLVVPTDHHENLYVLPPASGHAVHDLVQEVAVAIRATYGCDGVSTRQHNEPAGDQDVWHHHVHVFPRYAGDDLYGSQPLAQPASAEQRLPYAEKLRGYFAGSPSAKAYENPAAH